MAFYEIGFDGLALAGMAIVEAESKEDALLKFKKEYPDDKPSRTSGEFFVEKLEEKNGVIFYWNGDY